VKRLTHSAAGVVIPLLLAALGLGLWVAHGRAWGIGRSSPVLGYDAAQYAVAARTLAREGRFATPYALPIELLRHGTPPWPLAVVQPGLVLVEAALLRFAPPRVAIGNHVFMELSGPERAEWFVLALPFVCYLALGLFAALLVVRILERHAPGLGTWERATAALVTGAVVLLDPEAQHFSTGGFTELPYTLGVVLAIASLALGRAHQFPLVFGLLLGVTGAFRATMLWTLPLFAVGAALTAPRGGRVRTAALVLAGFALPLMPWWIYKARAFGDPGWDLTRLVVWDGIQGRTWFSLYHLPVMPDVPQGLAALQPLAAKVARNLPRLLLALATGPRALWAGALLAWLLFARPARPLAVAGWVVLGHAALSMLTGAVSIPWLRYVFPARVPLEVAGVLAVWALLARVPGEALSRTGLRVTRVAVAVLAIAWGVFQTGLGLREARAASGMRGLPSVLSLIQISRLVVRDVPREQPVMSNLGPTLAWYSRHPVIHLALSPADLEACRERVEFRHVVLVFRDPDAAWAEWRAVLADPARAPHDPAWNVRRVRVFATSDGFQVVWLELGPPRPRLAMLSEGR
jgi:hypothetical protein